VITGSGKDESDAGCINPKKPLGTKKVVGKAVRRTVEKAQRISQNMHYVS